MFNKALHSNIVQWVIVALALGMTFAMVFGPVVQRSLFPVLTVSTVETVHRPSHEVTIQSEGFKNFRCPVERVTIAYIDKDGLNFSAKPKGNPNRVTYGPYKIVTTIVVEGEATFPGILRRTYFYRCHPLWLVEHEFEDIVVTKPDDPSAPRATEG